MPARGIAGSTRRRLSTTRPFPCQDADGFSPRPALLQTSPGRTQLLA